MNLAQACAYAARHDRRIGVMLANGKPMFYFITACGGYVYADSGPVIMRALARADAAGGWFTATRFKPYKWRLLAFRRSYTTLDFRFPTR